MKIGHTRPNGTPDTRDIVLGARSVIVGLVLLLVPGLLSFIVTSKMMGQDVKANTAVNVAQTITAEKQEERIDTLETAQAVMANSFEHIEDGIKEIKRRLE